MACCVAIACVFAAVRAAWAWIPGRNPVGEVFPPAATWRSGRAAGKPARDTSSSASGLAAETPVGHPLAAAVVVYALLVHLLVATGAARNVDSWLTRDAVLLSLATVLIGVARRPMSMPSALVCVGALWFALGMVDMHVLSGVEIPSLIVDAAFHLSGWWLAVAAAGVLVVERRAESVPVGDSV